jgi:hypothetical protein
MPPEVLFPWAFGRPFGFAAYAPDDGAGGGGGEGGGSGDGGGAGEAGGSGSSTAGGSGSTDSGTNGGQGQDDPAALRRELEAARNEAAKSRRELQKLRQASETEQERRERELAEAREAATSSSASLRTLRVENAVLRQAASFGIVDPDAAATLLRLPDDAFTDAGEVDPDKVKAGLRELVKGKPYLVRQGGAAAGDGGAGDRQSGDRTTSMNDLIRQAAGRGR